MGENSAMSDPDQTNAQQALAMLDHLVVQDIFLTETAWHADVVLPASAHAEKLGTYTNTNRQVQIGRPAHELPGEARQDWELIVDLARRIGLDWNYGHVSDVYAEMASVMPSLKHIPGIASTRGIGDLSGRRSRQAWQRDHLLVRIPDRRRTRPHRAGRSAAAR
jgi:formate dehydrogenase major subunit